MKSILLAAAFSLAAFTLGAAEKAAPSKRNGCCPPPCPCPPPTQQPNWLITPPVAPAGNPCPGYFFTADFIWWKTNISNSNFAANGFASGTLAVVGGSQTSTGPGRIQHPKFEFEPGFKVGAGVFLPHDGWDLYACYTWLHGGRHTNGISATSSTNAINLVPSSGAGIAVAQVLGESCTWKQRFNVIDLELGRNFFISRFLSLRPFAGLKGARIREHLHFNSMGQGTSGGLNPGITLSPTQQYRRQNMWGLGPRIGLDSLWHFTKEFGLYADFAFSLLWTDYHTHFHDTSTSSSTGISVTSITVFTKEVITNVTPVVEVGLGLSYMHWFCGDDYFLEAHAGWEGQCWWDFNHFTDYANKSGNLTLHGLTAGLKFGF